MIKQIHYLYKHLKKIFKTNNLNNNNKSYKK